MNNVQDKDLGQVPPSTQASKPAPQAQAPKPAPQANTTAGLASRVPLSARSPRARRSSDADLPLSARVKKPPKKKPEDKTSQSRKQVLGSSPKKEARSGSVIVTPKDSKASASARSPRARRNSDTELAPQELRRPKKKKVSGSSSKKVHKKKKNKSHAKSSSVPQAQIFDVCKINKWFDLSEINELVARAENAGTSLASDSESTQEIFSKALYSIIFHAEQFPVSEAPHQEKEKEGAPEMPKLKHIVRHQFSSHLRALLDRLVTLPEVQEILASDGGELMAFIELCLSMHSHG